MAPSTPRSRHRTRPLYVEILIRASMERVWELTQDPALHSRWDGRFTAIVPTAVREDGAQLFRYELDLPGHTIRGTGVSLGEASGTGGSRTSALLFDTEDRLSPIGAGRGYWRYIPHPEGVRFITGYDYTPGLGTLGRLVDPVVRRALWTLTAWSFDRLRIWAEEDVPPEQIRWWKGWIRGPRARSSTCLSAPQKPGTGDVMDDAPESLGRIARHG